MPQTLVGCVSEKCSTCVDPAANAAGAATATATAIAAANRSNVRYISFLSFHPPRPGQGHRCSEKRRNQSTTEATVTKLPIRRMYATRTPPNNRLYALVADETSRAATPPELKSGCRPSTGQLAESMQCRSGFRSSSWKAEAGPFGAESGPQALFQAVMIWATWR